MNVRSLSLRALLAAVSLLISMAVGAAPAAIDS